MTTAVIVQARMGSGRLPGKVLLDLAGRPVLAHVLERCRAIPGADVVICAVAEGPGAESIADVAAACGARVFVGSETDVLARYDGAARMVQADVVMRVTSDCPLIDPVVCGQVLDLVRGGGADYACNNMPASWPHGLDCEAFTATVLARAAAMAEAPHEREHVTPFMRAAPGIRRANVESKDGRGVDWRLTLDYPEDLVLLRELFALLPATAGIPSLADVLDTIDRHPHLAAINLSRRGNSRPAGTAH